MVIGGVVVEHFILQKAEYHKLIPEEDQFLYPIIFQTPLLSARYIGKVAELRVRERKEKFGGMLFGVSDVPLIDHFKIYFRHSLDVLNASALPFDETEQEWLEAHLLGPRRISGIKYFSKPGEPPYYLLLSEQGDFLVFSSCSESELEDLPQINYNKIITNEAIEQLVSFLKSNLPKKLQHRKKGQRQQVPFEQKLKQMRISKF